MTEEVTGIDLVRSQIQVSMGYRLSDPEVGLPAKPSENHRNSHPMSGYHEDPTNSSALTMAGLRIIDLRAGWNSARCRERLQWGRRQSFLRFPVGESERSRSQLTECRCPHGAVSAGVCIRGVKTNIPFLISLITHPTFLAGEATTR